MNGKYATRGWSMSIYGDLIQDVDRLQYPDKGDSGHLVKQILARKALGDGFVVLVDGAFDVPHPLHESYLRHVRALAGAALLDEQGLKITRKSVRDVISGDDITVVATVDADSKIADKKGNKPEKGGVARPIYPWTARAERVLGYTFDTTFGDGPPGAFRSVVDIATVEGDPGHKDTPFESSLTLAEHLKGKGVLDRLVVYGEHQQTETEAREKGLDPIVILDGAIDPTENLINPQTGKPWSSSALISRAQGKEVPYPITRPTHLFR